MTSSRSACGELHSNHLSLTELTSDRSFTVNNYWPRQSVTVPAIKGMYQKMLQSELNGTQSSSAQPVNGQKNGA